MLIHHVPKQRPSTVVTALQMPLRLVLIPAQPATTTSALDQRLVTSTHLAMISTQATMERTHLCFLTPWTHTSVVPILLMRQLSAICPALLEVLRSAQLVKHAMVIRHAVVVTRHFVERRGMMRQVNVKILAQPGLTKNVQMARNVSVTHLAPKTIHSSVESISSMHLTAVPILVQVDHRRSVRMALLVFPILLVIWSHRQTMQRMFQHLPPSVWSQQQSQRCCLVYSCRRLLRPLLLLLS